ncbi:MAG: hypothetical protein U1A27_09810 [Phycisphaerae bacterium]
MIHSGPKPLKVALEIHRRLMQELGRFLTPEQRRDFVRVTKLMDEAEKNHVIEITRLHQRTAQANDPGRAPPTAPEPRRKRFWFSS